MKLDFEMLHEACFEAARRSMWDVRLTDVAKISVDFPILLFQVVVDVNFQLS